MLCFYEIVFRGLYVCDGWKRVTGSAHLCILCQWEYFWQSYKKRANGVKGWSAKKALETFHFLWQWNTSQTFANYVGFQCASRQTFGEILKAMLCQIWVVVIIYVDTLCLILRKFISWTFIWQGVIEKIWNRNENKSSIKCVFTLHVDIIGTFFGKKYLNLEFLYCWIHKKP